MKYIIYLDTQQIDEFDSDEDEALKKYNELKEEYDGEDIYDEIRMYEIREFKSDTL